MLRSLSPFNFLCSPFYGMDAIAPSPPTPLPRWGRGEDFVFLQRARLSRSFALPRPGGEGRTFRGAKRDDQISNSRAGLRPSL